MHRQGYDLQLTQYDDRGWRATFYTTGMEHSPTSATGTGWERTPWRDAAGGARGVEENGGAMNYTCGWMLPLALCALMLAGCGPPHGLIGTLPSLPDPDQAAEIIVFRESQFFGGRGSRRGVWLDGVLLYGISMDEHVVIKVAPGNHIIGVSEGSKEDAFVAVLAEPRQRYYFRVGVPDSGVEIFPMAAGPAQAIIEKSRQVK